MDAPLSASWALPLAALAAAAMGFAIQRGATCTVAAMEEAVTQRRWSRLAAMLEASVWVAAGLLLARQLHWAAPLPMGFALNGWTVAGAVLLGLGAQLNRACVFGAVARLGNGEWAYAATPLGFYLGCLSAPVLFAPPTPEALPQGSWVLAMADLTQWPLLLFVLWRLLRPWARHPASRRLTPAWTPRTATLVIGVTFLLTLMLAGAWAYTDLLAMLAQGMAQGQLPRALLALALLAGAMLGGWHAGRLRRVPLRVTALLRCTAGGLLMGWGSLLIPGSNDGLILLGMPLLWPYAWVGFATMCLSIGAVQLAQQRGRAGT